MQINKKLKDQLVACLILLINFCCHFYDTNASLQVDEIENETFSDLFDNNAVFNKTLLRFFLNYFKLIMSN